MRRIDLEHWPRHAQFETFSAWEHPHFSLCADMDITPFYDAVKQHGASINVAIVYVIARAANAITEFRYRIREGTVVEHDVVHPATTILLDGNQFTFCSIPYHSDFPTFAAEAAERIAFRKQHPTLKDEHGRDDELYMTAIPWLSFTSFVHPVPGHGGDSVPRFAWGKFFFRAGRRWMPLNVQAHHGLMDGIHAGWFYEHVQDDLCAPGWLGGRPARM